MSFVYIMAFTLWVSISVGLRVELRAGSVMEDRALAQAQGGNPSSKGTL